LTKEIGLEVEFFIEDLKGNIVEPPITISTDECGFLGEIRTKPFSSSYHLVGNLIAELMEVEKSLEERNLRISKLSYYKPSKEEIKHFLLRYPKKLEPTYSIYSTKDANNLDSYWRAGTHIHFSSSWKETIIDSKNNSREIIHYYQLNIPLIIKTLDEKFKNILKDNKRHKGIYRLKEHGFEYRSLPNSFIIINYLKNQYREIEFFLSKVFDVFYRY
jgi:hypothetical protein